jgi:hypothetical protein
VQQPHQGKYQSRHGKTAGAGQPAAKRVDRANIGTSFGIEAELSRQSTPARADAGKFRDRPTAPALRSAAGLVGEDQVGGPFGDHHHR